MSHINAIKLYQQSYSKLNKLKNAGEIKYIFLKWFYNLGGREHLAVYKHALLFIKF